MVQAVDPYLTYKQRLELGDRLREASCKGDWEEVAALLAAGAPADLYVARCPLLHYAVQDEQLEVVKLMLQNGADPNADGWFGPPLYNALFYTYPNGGFQPKFEVDEEIVRELVAAGADPDEHGIFNFHVNLTNIEEETYPGYTMMHAAAMRNAPHVLDLLGKLGADTEVRFVSER